MSAELPKWDPVVGRSVFGVDLFDARKEAVMTSASETLRRRALPLDQSFLSDSRAGKRDVAATAAVLEALRRDAGGPPRS